jgi:hypothetical protein
VNPAADKAQLLLTVLVLIETAKESSTLLLFGIF